MTVPLARGLRGEPDDPLVVLLHSIGTDRELWRDHVDPLAAAGHRVAALDLRGHGASPVPQGPYAIAELADDVTALMDTLGYARADVVGVSIGGAVGLWLAAHAPGRVARLVVCCTAAYFGGPEVWAPRAAAARKHELSALADGTVERWFTPQFRHDHADRVGPIRRTFLHSPAEGYAACAEALAAYDLRLGLGRITAPTLVVAGRHDTATPVDTAARPLADGIAGARLQIVDAAHLAPYERPDIVGPLVHDHLHAREAA